MTESTLKRFTVSLDAGDYDALCALAQAQRPPLSLQYTVRLAIRRFLDEYEGRAIKLARAPSPRARRGNRSDAVRASTASNAQPKRTK